MPGRSRRLRFSSIQGPNRSEASRTSRANPSYAQGSLPMCSIPLAGPPGRPRGRSAGQTPPAPGVLLVERQECSPRVLIPLTPKWRRSVGAARVTDPLTLAKSRSTAITAGQTVVPMPYLPGSSMIDLTSSLIRRHRGR